MPNSAQLAARRFAVHDCRRRRSHHLLELGNVGGADRKLAQPSFGVLRVPRRTDVAQHLGVGVPQQDGRVVALDHRRHGFGEAAGDFVARRDFRQRRRQGEERVRRSVLPPGLVECRGRFECGGGVGRVRLE